jgi:hypothetical protein
MPGGKYGSGSEVFLQFPTCGFAAAPVLLFVIPAQAGTQRDEGVREALNLCAPSRANWLSLSQE